MYLSLLATEAQALVDPSPDSDSESDSSSESSDDEIEDIGSPSSAILQNILALYASRYISERPTIPKSNANLHLLLDSWKSSYPDIFQSYVQVTPACFDLLTATLGVNPVFHNESNIPQMPVAEQLAIALFRFGHYGNAANIMKTALWAGVGYGTVHLATNRVIKAICGEQFRQAALHWPNEAVTEAAKSWVEDNSCPAWRNGWAMVDGTLVPLYARPAFFGNTWYDRKSNYSMNVQVSYSILLQSIIANTLSRLYPHLTCRLLTTLLGCLAVSMMPLPFWTPALLKSIVLFSKKVNLYGLILPILFTLGVKLLIKSKLLSSTITTKITDHFLQA